MKKLYLFSACACLFLLAACGGGESVEFSTDELASALAESSCFTDLLSEMEDDVVLEIYGIDPESVESCSAYFGTGATAEEIAVFKAADEDAAQTVGSALQKRVESQITAYENYVPSEVPKLEAAIVETRGAYSVYVTAADAAGAQEIIDGYMGS